MRELIGKVQVYTGAGICSAAGVSDLCGPSGVWTFHTKGKTVVEPDFTEVGLLAAAIAD